MDDFAWFLAIADAENVTDAAAVVGIAQPTLSRRLAALERSLGAPLFDRPGRRLVLNEAGRLYADAARRADLTMAVARQRIAELDETRSATLRLGFLHSFGPWLVPNLLAGLASQVPRLRHQLVQDAAGTIGGLVADGDLDVGIVSPRPAQDGRLAWKRIMRQPIAAALPMSHHLASQRTITLSALADESFVTMPRRYGMRVVLDDACAAAGFRPHIAVECQELGTVGGLVGAGLGVALLPDVSSADHQRNDGLPAESTPPPGVRLVPLAAPGLAREIGFIWARDRALPSAARALINSA